MQKISLLILMATILTACQPTATPTPEPVETLAGSVSDIVGLWWSPQERSKVEIKADGTFRAFINDETFDEGTYIFEAGKITWTTIGHGSCENMPITQEAYVTIEDGKPTWLRLQTVGTDPCVARDRAARKPLKYLGP